MDKFELVSDFKPTGDQPQAIDKLTERLQRGEKRQTLLGVTGSGKTFSVATIIANVNKPALVLSHNKTLAAQLFSEFKKFFPKNAVEYFVSYYDYYQPEAYVPQTDTYIEKDSSVNDELDRLRLSATSSLLERQDVIIVSSVSCIYGIGSPEDFRGLRLPLQIGLEQSREDILRRLVEIQYERNDVEFSRGKFRVRGDIVEIFPAYAQNALRVEMFGDQVDRISRIDPLTGRVEEEVEKVSLYPAKQFVIPQDRLKRAIGDIKVELAERLEELEEEGKLLEAQRLRTRTRYDIEMMLEIGYCQGIENYSRHMSGRRAGEPPYTLLDYFPDGFLTFIDESHVSLPQVRGMYAGDQSRKSTLVEHGFRLPSALDNRPLSFEEFQKVTDRVIYVSATPGPYELEHSKGRVVEQIIRPTGLIDPKIWVRPIEGQIDNLLEEVRTRAERGERVLVTTLTKKMAEDLTDYFDELGVKVRYLHSDIQTLDRVDILRDLRLGEFDCLIGINLLREGLDLPEVSLVAILDADKEGFLRSGPTLIQTIGRAARNVNGEVILYADKRTDSMEKAINETNRRRYLQTQHNKKHDITPQTVVKAIDNLLQREAHIDPHWDSMASQEKWKVTKIDDLGSLISYLEDQMKEASQSLQFEKAAVIRDEIKRLKRDEKAFEEYTLAEKSKTP